MIAPARTRSLTRGLGRASLVPAAALLVHQLRFVLAFGGGAGAQLARQGHAYLHSLVPWVVLLLGVAAGCFLRSLGRALAGQRSASRYTLSLTALWIICSACLLTIYVAQEFLEGLYATGHPAGLVGIFGYGGWWAIPASACVGLVLAAVLHGARWTLDAIASRAIVTFSPRVRSINPRGRRDLIRPRLEPLAEGWSGRGPPR